MTDPELEDLLRRYRPAGPSPELRGRVVADAWALRRTWPWAAAAVAMLALVAGLQVSTQRLYRTVAADVAPPRLSEREQVPALRGAVDDEELLKRLMDGFARLEREESAAAQLETGIGWQ